ncbi:MAG: gamma-glutamyltransferase [Hyphomicrobiales bacterium]|nr:MAG: gamma-glutamyltransferase [Hyphomicrobiales bacterium]
MNRSRSTRGAVAAGHVACVDAAAEILADGGNAFDAAIAALWTSCVVEPVLASPGGGGFLMARPAAGAVMLHDFFVDTPGRKRHEDDIEFTEIHADFGTATQAFHIGAGASATPGFVPGLFAVHEELGSLPMRRLAEPAVRVARDGVAMTAFQAFLAEVVSPILTWTAEARALFAPDGELLKTGALYRNPDLADTLDVLSREGLRFATEGELAGAMAACCSEAGHLTQADIAGYRVARRDPLMRKLGSWQVALNPPPSLGGALIATMLSDLEQRGEPGPAALAAAVDRTDRHWRVAPTDPYRLLGASGGKKSAGVASRGTTHVSVVDEDGNVASATVSNGEGNGRIVPGCGFMVNNMLGEEDVNPGGFHRWTPGHRLASMMAPTIAADKEGALLAVGSGGSNRIRTAVLQVLSRRLREGQPLEEAVTAPRIHVEKGHCDFEDFFSSDERHALVSAFPDHRAWAEQSLFFGGAHSAERSRRGGFSAVGDPRREGAARVG